MALQTDGRKVREFRELSGMTQEQFARRIEFSVTHVSQVERGKSNGGLRFLRQAAKILGCEISEITRGSIPRRSPSQDVAA
jgi:transcriptional regulator with XRE-family HTH domain